MANSGRIPKPAKTNSKLPVIFETQPVSQMGCQAAVDLFRVRGEAVLGPESGLDMRHGNPLVKGRQAGDESRGRVALSDDHIRTIFSKYLGDAGKNPGRHLFQLLAGPHDVEVMMDGDVKQACDLVEQVAMLGRGANRQPEIFRAAFQLMDNRRQLDGFRARSEDDT